MNATLTSAALVLAASLAGCASDYHYSKIDGYRYFKAPLDTYPVLVTKIDGQSTPLSTPVLVEPGPRQVAVQTYPDQYHRFGEERTISLDVKPCTHYYLVAVKPNRISADFDVKIDYEQSVPGCTPPGAK
ncbi:MAG TPA: hypothetical protein VF169_16230 [Albitalea sp.]|uniref:hypothetical protein n=1 Tax=Piscinibacter sp. TaxID=1903157 RepID=UPI002ED60059